MKPKGQLSRSQGLARKAAKPKRRVTGCEVRGCQRRGPFEAVPERRCKFHLRQEADRLWSIYIRQRDGKCMAEGWWGLECKGGLQAMHGMSRRYNATRWSVLNGKAGCAAHHDKMTHSHAHHEEFWGHGGPLYEQLRKAALYNAPMDPADVIRKLREEP